MFHRTREDIDGLDHHLESVREVFININQPVDLLSFLLAESIHKDSLWNNY